MKDPATRARMESEESMIKMALEKRELTESK
jgi:hypothetical protein